MTFIRKHDSFWHRAVFRRHLPALLLASVSVAHAPAAHAGMGSAWTIETFAQFDAGEASFAFVTSNGEVRPGWETTRTAMPGDAIWSLVRTSDGAWLAGTDEKGGIYSVRGTTAKKVVALDGAIAVVALATAGNNVFATAMPGTSIFQIDAAAGKAKAIVSLPKKDVETIWSLAAGRDGTLYAGTGPSGKLFAVRDGKATEVFATGDKRITAIVVDQRGAADVVWFGTSERALVFRYDAATRQTRAVADFAGNEISAIELAGDREGVIVAANELADSSSGVGKTANQVDAIEKPNAAKGQATKTPEVNSKPGTEREAPTIGDMGRRGAKKGKGALFWVTSDARLTQLHALTQTYFTAIAVDKQGTIFAGAADKGRVYQIARDGEVGAAVDVDERAISHLRWDGDTLVFATDDTAGIGRTSARAGKANYVSEVFDGKAAATFGRLSFQATGNVLIETRSGNVAKPGPGWSEWQALTDVRAVGPTASNGRSGRMVSPAGRYLQLRASLRDGQSAVRRLSAFYVPQNQATLVEEVTVELANRETSATTKDVAKTRTPLLRAKWRIDNADGDDTVYTLAVRRDGDSNWRPLNTGKTPLQTTSFEWNTETYPDGYYRLRVTASDHLVNAPDRAQQASAQSVLFAVDNTRPTLSAPQVTLPTVRLSAEDGLSLISEMAYAFDDGTWQIGAAEDGVFDDLQEKLRITVPSDLSKGTHTLAIRVADAAGNIASTVTTLVIK